MTEREAAAQRAPRRRAHPAARARIITAGIAGTAAFTMVAGMALPHLGAPASASAPTSQSIPSDTRSVTQAPVPSSSLAPAPVTTTAGS